MKYFAVLAATFLLSALPARASQPAFGAQVELNHVADGDDRVDIQINNLTGMPISWGSADPYNAQVDAWAVTSNSFAPGGFQATLSGSTASSLTTLRWLHTEKDSPFWAQNYNIWCGPGCPNTYQGSGYYNFWLITYPYSKNDLITDLELAFHVLEAIGNVVEIALGDEEAEEELSKNVTEAIDEGNEIANEPNNGWCGVVYADNNLSTPVGSLAYPIIGTTGSKKDHLAVNINNTVVAQVMTVNQKSSITGNTQYVVSFYTYQQWVANYSGKALAPPAPVKAPAPPDQPPPTAPFPSRLMLAR